MVVVKISNSAWKVINSERFPGKSFGESLDTILEEFNRLRENEMKGRFKE